MTRLLRNIDGVTALEFALVAPVFMMFMFLVIDGARVTWTYQTLQEVAANSARCAALSVPGCKTADEVKTHAVARAAASGVKLSAASVTMTTAQNCLSMPGMTKVAIASSYQGATTKLLPSSVSTLATESCFPTAGA